MTASSAVSRVADLVEADAARRRERAEEQEQMRASWQRLEDGAQVELRRAIAAIEAEERA